MNEQEKTTEITFGFLLAVLRRRLIWLLLALVIGAGGALALTKLMIAPTYSSSAKFAVESTVESGNMMSSGYQVGAALYAANYADEIKGNVFLSEVLRTYNGRFGKELTLKQLSEKITATADGDLANFTVKIVSTDAQEAYDILSVVQELAPEILLNDSTRTYINIKMVNYGSLDTVADSPNVFLNTALGGMLLVALVYVYFFLRAFLDKTIYNEENLKTVSGNMPIIGLIPQWFTKRQEGSKRFVRESFDSDRDPNHIQRNYEGRLLSEDTPFSVVESFKTLRTNLTYVAHKDNTSPVFGVTSGFAGAGKSVVIANVAISFAQLGKKVLLIDGDMRCPVQHKIFSLEGERHGLSEVLAGIEQKPFENAVVKNAYEGLDVLVCGHIPPNPSELLSSARMQQLLAEAKEQYDYVFIDLPPILETADAGVVTSIVSSYILVVRAGYSKLPAIAGVVETMQTMHASVAGFVLNDINAKGALGYYHYGSRYGYQSRYSKYAYRTKDADNN